MDTSQTGNLAQVNSGPLSNHKPMTLSVSQLESALLGLFPAQDAEEWDRTGLLCGDPFAQVTGVAVALDASVRAVAAASDLGANVLVTHHPAFLDPPDRFGPARNGFFGPGAAVWEAVRAGVALMNFHTALDVSPLAQTVLPSMLSLELQGVVDCTATDPARGYGQLCQTTAGENLSLSSLAARCTSVFGRIPRVWGDENASVSTIVTCTGSSSDLPELCLERGYDCLVCGEIRYHTALEASNSGLSIVELGHDVSELPLCAVLARAVESSGVPQEAIKILDQGRNWWTPEATRR